MTWDLVEGLLRSLNKPGDQRTWSLGWGLEGRSEEQAHEGG